MRRRWGEIGKKSNSYTFDFILKIIKEEWTLKQLPQNLCILYKNFVKPHVGFFVYKMYFYIDNFSVKLSYVRVCIDEQNKSICRIFRQSIFLIFYFVVPTKSWDFFFVKLPVWRLLLSNYYGDDVGTIFIYVAIWNSGDE